MKVHTQFTTIGSLFSERNSFEVPKYQRNYAWEEEEVSDFISDIMECLKGRLGEKGVEKKHFYGGIVCVKEEIDGTSRVKYEIVDGQQRLATFVILASCLILKLDQIKQDVNQQGLHDRDQIMNDIKDKLLGQYKTFKDTVNLESVMIEKIILSKADKDYFKQQVIYNSTVPQLRESHKRINKAKEDIMNALNNIFSNVVSLDKKLTIISKLMEVLEKDCNIIFINTTAHSDAYRLFQVLNDRGTSLTEGDLLRAKTLELLDDGRFSAQQEAVESSWDEILKDSSKKTNDLLVWQYESIVGQSPKKAQLYDDYLIKIFPEQIPFTIDVANNIKDRILNIQSEFTILSPSFAVSITDSQ